MSANRVEEKPMPALSAFAEIANREGAAHE